MIFQLRDCRFDIIEDIQGESQEVLETLALENLQGYMWNRGKSLGFVVCMPKGITLEKMMETKSRDKQLFCGQIPCLFRIIPEFWVAPDVFMKKRMTTIGTNSDHEIKYNNHAIYEKRANYYYDESYITLKFFIIKLCDFAICNNAISHMLI